VHRFVQFGLLTLLTVTLALSQEPNGSVSGTVIDADTQVSVGGAVVVMSGTGQVMTDEAGRFRISSISPGTHVIHAVRTGMAAPAGESQLVVTIMPGQELHNLRLQLAPFGVIRGRISDENGTLLGGASVEALLEVYERGERIFKAPTLPAGNLNYSAKTDVNGDYRIELPQGAYYIRAQAHAPTTTAGSVARVFHGTPMEYYPGTTDPALAAKVKVDRGEAPGIDFRVSSEPKDLHRITVRIVGARQPALTLASAGIQFAELRDRFSPARMPVLAALRHHSPDPEIVTIEGVPRGSYDLFMDGVMTDGHRGRGVAGFDVRDEDLSDIVLTMHAAQDISGRIAPADAFKVAPASLTISLGTRRVSVGPDGHFVIPEVLDGFYAVRVDGLPSDAYIADIRYGGNSLHETARTLHGPELHTGPVSTPLEIIVASNGGTVEGNVEAGPGATVVLVPGAARRFVPSYYRVAVAGKEGSFSLTGVPPGTYQLFAWDKVPETAWLNPDFISRWEGRGQAISIDVGRIVYVKARLLSQKD